MKTFQGELYDKVLEALVGAVSIAWDGCHKIYIMADEVSQENMSSWGYCLVPVHDLDESLNTLYGWYSSSCPLRFIERFEGSDLTTVIGQMDG